VPAAMIAMFREKLPNFRTLPILRTETPLTQPEGYVAPDRAEPSGWPRQSMIIGGVRSWRSSCARHAEPAMISLVGILAWLPRQPPATTH